MKKDEARKVLKTMATADGGCCSCASDLMISFVRDFPQFLDLAQKVYHEEFSYRNDGGYAERLGLKDENWKEFLKEVREGK